MRYPIVIERGPGNFSAYAPDVPGCVAAAASRSDVIEQMAAALSFHFEGLRASGEPIPQPSSSDTYVDVPPVR